MNTNSTLKIDNNLPMVTVALNMITHHVMYDQFSKIMAITNYIIPSSAILSEQALILCLQLHPIIVIRTKKDNKRYQCIGGIRSFLLAKSSLMHEHELQVMLIARPSQKDIELLISADALLSPMAFSIRNISTIGAIHEQIHKTEKEVLLKTGMNNKESFANELGFSKNTVFSKKTNNN